MVGGEKEVVGQACPVTGQMRDGNVLSVRQAMEPGLLPEPGGDELIEVEHALTGKPEHQRTDERLASTAAEHARLRCHRRPGRRIRLTGGDRNRSPIGQHNRCCAPGGRRFPKDPVQRCDKIASQRLDVHRGVRTPSESLVLSTRRQAGGDEGETQNQAETNALGAARMGVLAEIHDSPFFDVDVDFFILSIKAAGRVNLLRSE